jgi:hypothetical protein
VGELAYLGRVYEPACAEAAFAWAKAGFRNHPYIAFITDIANGFQIANVSLHGLIEGIDRAVDSGLGQPISLDYGNTVERPSGLASSDMVIGAIVGWSARGAYVMGDDGRVRLVHCFDGSVVAAEWPALGDMLRCELTRVAALHDPDGRELTTATDLMHPNGRRWETEIEPGSVRH